MRISTKGRYALHLMLDLARQPGDKYVSLKAVAQRQGISEKYLEQIIPLLSKAQLLQSARGAQGGYRLARDKAAITVGQILRLAEGSLSPVQCLDTAFPCDKVDSCLTIGLYRRLQAAIDQVVDNTTLADLVEEVPPAGQQEPRS